MGLTLHLPLKKEWYEMIESGVKTEEYRILSYHWIARLLADGNGKRIKTTGALKLAFNAERLLCGLTSSALRFREFETVKFSYGYTQRTMTFNVKEIHIGLGNPEWGSPKCESVFVIRLGDRIE